MTDPWDSPEPGGDQFRPSEHVGETVFMTVYRIDAQQQTQYGVQDLAKVGLSIIRSPLNAEHQAQQMDNVQLYNPGIVDRLRTKVGKVVLGRFISMASSKAGFNPAIIFDQPDEEDKVIGRKAYDWHVKRFPPSGSGQAPPSATPPPAPPPPPAAAPASPDPWATGQADEPPF